MAIQLFSNVKKTRADGDFGGWRRGVVAEERRRR
jgi:hypothetical protein